MNLIVGLGNPGSAYAKTRHNVGRMAVQKFAHAYFPHSRFAHSPKLKALTLLERSTGGHPVILCLPETFMNNSGEAVRAIQKFYKIPLANILIVLDEIQLKLGQIRIREQGSDGGHNGLASVETHLQSSLFPRLRIGIHSSSTLKQPLEKFVLKPFTKKEMEQLPVIFEKIKKALALYLQDGIKETMNKCNA
ncbi:MAG: Peptidyl-tRNA hydrolase [Parcubacteria group bacterium GW2011_GWA2_44_12]|nr:MAG: Peptidyl-tRNA hydrolase [Parcubacteria group bacterium GW2011_GWA2_44_12]